MESFCRDLGISVCWMKMAALRVIYVWGGSVSIEGRGGVGQWGRVESRKKEEDGTRGEWKGVDVWTNAVVQ